MVFRRAGLRHDLNVCLFFTLPFFRFCLCSFSEHYTHAVFDQIISVVDYTLFVVTGQTIALAWELPHQPLAIDDLFNTPVDEYSGPGDPKPIVAPVDPIAQQQQQYQQQLQQYHQATNMLRPFFQPQQQSLRPTNFVGPFIPVRRKDSYYFGNRDSYKNRTSAIPRWLPEAAADNHVYSAPDSQYAARWLHTTTATTPTTTTATTATPLQMLI